jgi:hypothetical protein
MVVIHTRKSHSAIGALAAANPEHLNAWLKKMIHQAELKQTPHHTVVKEFRATIESDPELYM